jgi:hypothetical protein
VKRCAIAVAGMALLFAGASPAKGPDLARVCGASGCSSIRGDIHVYALLEWTGTGFSLLAAPRPAPYYRFSLFDRGRPVSQLLYVPSQRRIRIWELSVYPYGSSTGPYWRNVTRAGASVLGKATRGLRPFAAPQAWR